MGKTKEKGSKMGKVPQLSARPTFEFDIDLSDKFSTERTGLDNDDQSVQSSASKKMMKKVKNIISSSFHKAKDADMDERSLQSEFKKKKPSMSPPTIDSFIESNDKSKPKSKKKKKKGSGSVCTNGHDDEISVRSDLKKLKKSKKKKKKSKTDDDDDSVETTRSKKSTKKLSRTKSNEMLGTSLILENGVSDEQRMNELEIENSALMEETATIRRQLNDAEKALKKALSEQKQQGNFDQVKPSHRELEMAQTEARELKMELEEYEDAVIEKDELIQKLTEAVDAQLDKVELLEVKLVRAEEEFCKMEEEMKEMEDVIEDLRRESPGQTNHDNRGDSTKSEGRLSDEEILKELEKRERDIEKREQDLLEKEDYVLERETLIQKQNEELKMKRSSLLKQQVSFGAEKEKDDSVNSENHDTSNHVDELKAKIIQLECENNDMSEEIECLRKRDTTATKQEVTLENDHEIELKLLKDEFDKKMADSNLENEMLQQEIDALKQRNNSDGGELKSIRDDFEKKIADSNLENEILRQELDGLKQRKNSENEALRQQIEELRKQRTHVEASTRHMKRLESMRMLEVESTRSDDDDGEFGLEVEVEIAELREKIVEQEECSRKLRQEIATHVSENEEIKQELQERELEMKGLENQLSKSKETSIKKMQQKDETITFMQNEMMKIMQEKQQLDKKMRGNNLDRTQTQLMNSRAEDEAEKAKLDAINAELRKLDDENRLMEDELKEYKYNSSLKLKEKESIILEMQEELSDVKWELGAREKGADYITLLKDRKERKNQLNKARKELKESEERVLELEFQNEELLSNKKDLEKEVESLTKGALSEDIAEQISGLKRQIKSLKQHNTALERKLETESRFSIDMLGEKESKIRILEFELEKLRNPAQTAIRGVVSGFIPGFGRRNNAESDTRAINERNDGVVNDNDKGNESNANTQLTKDDESKSTKIENLDSAAKDNGKTGNIWSLFAPRKELSNTANKGNAAGHSSSTSAQGFDNVGTKDNEKEPLTESPDGFEGDENL